MKDSISKFICIMLLLAVFQPAKAQSLRDYIRSRSKSSDSLLIKAITPSLSIIRQQYRLTAGGEYFGKNNRPFYGETYSLGIKVSGATIFQNAVVRPWEYDEDYQRVKQSGKYKPVLFWSYKRSINDSLYMSVDWDLATDYTRPMDSDSLIYKNEDKISDFGLSIDYSAGHKSGYMVWAYSSTNTQDSTMHVFFRQTNLQVQASVENADIQMTPNEPEKLLGGLYVVPVFESGGRIRLTVVGVVSKNRERKWNLHLLTTEKGINREVDTIQHEEIKENQKIQQVESSDEEPTPVG